MDKSQHSKQIVLSNHNFDNINFISIFYIQVL